MVTAVELLLIVATVHAHVTVYSGMWDAARAGEQLGYPLDKVDVEFVAGDVDGIIPGKEVRGTGLSLSDRVRRLFGDLGAIVCSLKYASDMNRRPKFRTSVLNRLVDHRFWAVPGVRKLVWQHLDPTVARMDKKHQPLARELRTFLNGSSSHVPLKKDAVSVKAVFGATDDYIFDKLYSAAAKPGAADNVVISTDGDFRYGFFANDGRIDSLHGHYVAAPGGVVTTARDHLHADDPFGQRLVSHELSPAVTGAMAMLGQGSGDFCSPIVTRDGCAVRRLKGTHKLSSQGQYLVHLLGTEHRWGPPLAQITPARLLAATLGKIHGEGKTIDPVEIDRHVAQLGAGVLSRSGRGSRSVRVLRSAKNKYSVTADDARETLAAELGLNDERFVAKGRRCAQDVFLSALALVTPVATPAPVASIAETLASMELHAAALPPVPDLEPDCGIWVSMHTTSGTRRAKTRLYFIHTK